MALPLKLAEEAIRLYPLPPHVTVTVERDPAESAVRFEGKHTARGNQPIDHFHRWVVPERQLERARNPMLLVTQNLNTIVRSPKCAFCAMVPEGK